MDYFTNDFGLRERLFEKKKKAWHLVESGWVSYHVMDLAELDSMDLSSKSQKKSTIDYLMFLFYKPCLICWAKKQEIQSARLILKALPFPSFFFHQ